MLYYFLPSNQTFESTQLTLVFGIVDPDTASNDYLNELGLYRVVETPPPTSIYYSYTPVYTIDGDIAVQSWASSPIELETAKIYATTTVTSSSNSSASELVSNSGVSADIWIGAASQAVVDRPPVYNTLLDEMTVIGDNLATTLTAIDTATTVDEINNIVNPPTGILSTGRGSSGPLDLNVSEYTEFNSTTLTEADTELYIPGTSTVINYGEYVPNKFDSAGNCFLLGDYRVQIREVATSLVLAEFECPLNAGNVDVPF